MDFFTLDNRSTVVTGTVHQLIISFTSFWLVPTFRLELGLILMGGSATFFGRNVKYGREPTGDNGSDGGQAGADHGNVYFDQ